MEGDTTDNNIITGNRIGTDESGTSPIGNGLSGVRVQDADSNQVTVNVVAHNPVGVIVTGTVDSTRIWGNSIHSNTGLGIDLNNDGVTLNDTLDPDTGPNGLTNFPVVSSAITGATTQVTWSLNTFASVTVRVEFFSSPTCDPSGYGEGKTFLGFRTIATNGSGNYAAIDTLAAATALGEFITATASIGTVETSEFSLCRAPDSDSDTVIDTSDNCPRWPNTSQALPPWTVPAGDADCDGFPDSVAIGPPINLAAETGMGTNPAGHCASTTGTSSGVRNDEPPPDRWPVDFDDNGIANGSDLLQFAPVFGAVAPNAPYDARFNINGDDRINGSDFLKFAPFFGKTCA